MKGYVGALNSAGLLQVPAHTYICKPSVHVHHVPVPTCRNYFTGPHACPYSPRDFFPDAASPRRDCRHL